MATLSVEKIKEEYLQFERDLLNFESGLKTQIEKLITDEIKLGFPLQSRVKTLESIIEKHESRFTIKKSILELQDLIGFRIVLLFKRDIDKVISLINQNFNVIKFYDTADKLKNDQFGYSSKHYIVKIKSSWAEIPTLKGYENQVTEIQIRTLSQHNWAEASNVLQYKDESSVPKEIIRTISRVAAFLETVDLELERTLQERENYREYLEQQMDENLKLNVDILDKVLAEIMPNFILHDKEGYSTLLSELEVFKILTVADLKDTINKTIRFVNKEIEFYDKEFKSWERPEKVGIYDTSIITYMLSCIDYEKYRGIIIEKLLNIDLDI